MIQKENLKELINTIIMYIIIFAVAMLYFSKLSCKCDNSGYCRIKSYSLFSSEKYDFNINNLRNAYVECNSGTKGRANCQLKFEIGNNASIYYTIEPNARFFIKAPTENLTKQLLRHKNFPKKDFSYTCITTFIFVLIFAIIRELLLSITRSEINSKLEKVLALIFTIIIYYIMTK